MRSLLYGLFIFFALACVNACHQHEFTDQNGHRVNLTSHPGKWLIINYWAPWCEPCRQELPELNQFYLTHRHLVQVYGVDYDQPAAIQLIQLRKKMGIDFPLLSEDPAQALNLPDVQSLPLSFIYNPKGVLVKTLMGPQT